MSGSLHTENFDTPHLGAAMLAAALFLAATVPAHAQTVVPPPAEQPAQPTTAAPVSEPTLVPVVPRHPSLMDEPLYLREETRRWYGYHNLLVIAGSLVVAGLVGVAGHGGPAFVVGAAGIYLGPPTVHWAHGNAGKGFASLGVGVGGAMLFGMAGAFIKCSGDACEGESGGFGFGTGFLLGAAVSTAGYIIFDVGFLAYDEPRPDPKRAAPTSSFRIVPKVWVAQNQTTFGVSGEF
ncbi:MAG: hypothetical protein HY897_24875 [Deltaproteobacteria bacterium]|nr:hypothetical protein [Deltaproteobacteria bacterium]